MRSRTAVLALLAALAFAAPAAADICVKCIARECISGLTSGYINCGSNGTKCIQWDSCVSGVGQPGEIASCATPEKRWALARVEVRPARAEETRWRLARVEITPAPAAR